jgi:hypothetical protein
MDWGDPRESWQEAFFKERGGDPRLRNGSGPVQAVSRDWSKPRAIPWLPWNHPNAKVTSHKEAMRVCREWGIDPDKGGFISEAHEKRAKLAAKRNTRVAVGKMTPADRARVLEARRIAQKRKPR